MSVDRQPNGTKSTYFTYFNSFFHRFTSDIFSIEFGYAKVHSKSSEKITPNRIKTRAQVSEMMGHKREEITNIYIRLLYNLLYSKNRFLNRY